MVDIQAVSVVIAATSVVIGVINSIYSSRRARATSETALETRQIATYLDFMRRIQTKEWVMGWADVMYRQEWKDFDEWREKYGPVTNPEAWANFVISLQFYECLGLLVRRNIVDIALVHEHIGGARAGIWERVELLVKGFREFSNRPILWNSFEYLYNELKKYEEQLTTTNR